MKHAKKCITLEEAEKLLEQCDKEYLEATICVYQKMPVNCQTEKRR